MWILSEFRVKVRVRVKVRANLGLVGFDSTFCRKVETSQKRLYIHCQKN